jgi:hypothetical protein
VSILVAQCDSRAARYAVENWHYSKTLPVGKMIRYGIWDDGGFVGAVLYSRGASPGLGRAYGVAAHEVAELARVALCAHEFPVTQIVAQSLKMLKRDNPGLRLVLSFADPEHGHVGKIYQAGNWIYLGRTGSAPVFVDYAGKRFHQRVVEANSTNKQFGKRQANAVRRADLTKIFTEPKYRYGYPLDRAMRRALMRHALPYPSA